MKIDKDLHYTVTFSGKDKSNVFTGEVVDWQEIDGKTLAQVKWPKRTINTLSKDFRETAITKEPESVWINPQDNGFTLTATDNIYNLAVKAVKDGIKPGQSKTIFELQDTKIVVTRAKSQEKVNISFLNKPLIKQFQIAHYGQDNNRQSGGGKWLFASWQEYMNWTATVSKK